MHFPGRSTGPLPRCRKAGTNDRLPRCAVHAVQTCCSNLIIKNHKLLAFHGICAKINFVRNTEAVAQWQSACLWNKMLWVRAPPASLSATSSISLRVIWILVNFFWS